MAAEGCGTPLQGLGLGTRDSGLCVYAFLCVVMRVALLSR